MGVLNLTPDSFSDGGQYHVPEHALSRALEMIEQGAQIVDVGAESTRPGSTFISEEEELARLLPVLKHFPHERCILSVDTNKLRVQRVALECGAQLINDVMGGSDALFDMVAAHGAGVCVMHSSGSPEVMQLRTVYADVVEEVYAFLASRVERARAAGVPWVLCDPGLGFGKTLEQNLALMRATDRFAKLGDGVLIGASRKSWIGKLTGAPVQARLGGSLAAALQCARLGASVLRVHDVLETVQALAVEEALRL